MQASIQSIDISILAPKEREELFAFYKYLLFKTKQISSENSLKQKTVKLPQTFYSPLKVNAYQKFDRDEIYSDR